MIADRLKALRLERDMTHEQLAFRAGVSVATVQRAEASKHEPSLHTLASLAGALGVAVSELLDESTEAAS